MSVSCKLSLFEFMSSVSLPSHGAIYVMTLSSSKHMVPSDWVIINLKGCAKKLLWPDLRHCLGICLEGLRETYESLRRSNVTFQLELFPNFPNLILSLAFRAAY
jgi:hypothetical protein